jgi:hypothetical protein
MHGWKAFLLVVLWHTHRTQVAEEGVLPEQWDFEKDRD